MAKTSLQPSSTKDARASRRILLDGIITRQPVAAENLQRVARHSNEVCVAVILAVIAACNDGCGEEKL